MVKNLPTMRETWVQSLGWEDLLVKEMATHSSILAWKIHGWRNLVGYSPSGRKESDTTERLHFAVSWGVISIFGTCSGILFSVLLFLKCSQLTWDTQNALSLQNRKFVQPKQRYLLSCFVRLSLSQKTSVTLLRVRQKLHLEFLLGSQDALGYLFSSFSILPIFFFHIT